MNTYTLQLVNCAPGFYVLYPFQLTIRRDAHPPVIGTLASQVESKRIARRR